MLKLENNLSWGINIPAYAFISGISVSIYSNHISPNKNSFNVDIPSDITCERGCVLELYNENNLNYLTCTNIILSDYIINQFPKNINLRNGNNQASNNNQNKIMHSRGCPDVNIGSSKKKFTSTLFLKCLCDISRKLEMIVSAKVSKIVSGKNGSNLY